MTAKLLSSYLDFALGLAEEASPLALKYFESDLSVDTKQDGSPVTRADREIELLLRQRIGARFPLHGIIGEEYEQKQSGHELNWIIDPIDGTKSFIAGVPFFTTLIALYEAERPVLGVISAPALSQTMWAADGMGTKHNGVRCHVRKTESLDTAWFLTSEPERLFRAHPTLFGEIMKRVAVCRTWADANGYLLLARGKADIVLDPEMKIWDLGAVIPVVREAGGFIADMQGNEERIETSAVASTSKQLFSQLRHLPGYP